jgi:hypothetical protein
VANEPPNIIDIIAISAIMAANSQVAMHDLNAFKEKRPYVNYLQNRFFFFEKYKINLIVFRNCSAHNIYKRLIFSAEKISSPPEG